MIQSKDNIETENWWQKVKRSKKKWENFVSLPDS